MALAFIKFFPTDYIADTRTLSTHTKGCYMDLLCLLHDNGGQVEKSLDALSRFFGCNRKQAEKAIQELAEEGILEVEYSKEKQRYSFTQRRMLREEEEREYERTKKRRQRDTERDEDRDDDGTEENNEGDNERDKYRDRSGTKPETRSQKPEATTPRPPEKGGGNLKEEFKKTDWEALCKRKKLSGIGYEKVKGLDDNALAHLLAVYREKLSGTDIRLPLAVAKTRAAGGSADKDDLRTISAWLHPPPLRSDRYNPREPFTDSYICHCGGELKSEYTPGSGQTIYICQSCGRGYPKR